jgi:1-acyl-sn-glycerol-3-phosphate acyltransferase
MPEKWRIDSGYRLGSYRSSVYDMKDFLNRLYSIYAFGTYFVCMLLIMTLTILSMWLPARQKILFFSFYSRMITDTWGLLTGIRLGRENAEKLDKTKSYVIVCNHVNMLDILIVGTQFRHPVYTLVKKEFFKIPVLAQIIRGIVIPVDRSSRASKAKSLQVMTEKLHAGFSIIIFPEGTRNRGDIILQNFHDGAFNVAISAQVPVLPVVILNSKNMQPVNKFRVNPGKAVLRFLDPIPTTDLKLTDVPVLKNQVRELMLRELEGSSPIQVHSS